MSAGLGNTKLLLAKHFLGLLDKDFNIKREDFAMIKFSLGMKKEL